MMSDARTRPDPDLLLAQLRQNDPRRETVEHAPHSSPGKGTLKIFFGYAAGVGKTYDMLKAAKAAGAQGVDVVVGYVEPHPRPETTALLAGLEQLQPLRLPYRDMTLNELDVDAALARKPDIILVDELAHSNAGGCRNRKRYQDVEELLQAGISVWTTVNVQHLESLNDVVAAMTGVVVRERVPDSVFDRADQVELVDIEPEELIRRLKEGRIYKQTQVDRALGGFFLPANLTALREIALRRMADRVNRIARSERLPGQEPRQQIKEHILICLSGAPSNARVIRTAARMAEAFHGDFTALFVQPDGPARSAIQADKTLRANIRLAEDLGASVVTVEGEDIPSRIADYARMSGVSKIVVGRSPAGGLLWHTPTLMERLAELAPDMETYIIPDAEPARPGRPRWLPRGKRLKALMGTAPGSWKQWGITVLILLLCSAGGWFIRAFGAHDTGITGLYMFGVLGVAAFTTGPWYGVAASGLSVLLFDLLFVAPEFSLSVYDADYLVTFLLMFLVALSASALTSRARTQAQQSAVRALHNELLLTNSRRLQKAENEDAILTEAARQFSTLLGCDVVAYPVCQGRLGPAQLYSPRKEAQPPDLGRSAPSGSEEVIAAQWVMKNGRPAGAGTDTLPGARCHYIPISSGAAVSAVVGFAGTDAAGETRLPDTADKNLILALAGECALALEKERLSRANAAISSRAQQEKLRADVLRSISHDLRTPLTSICGNAAMLSGEISRLSVARQQELARSIEDDARYLIAMVENILALTRLEQYGFTLRMEAELVEDVVHEAVGLMRRRTGAHPVRTQCADPLLMARMDVRLTVQVLVNLLDNAVKYSPEDAPITIRILADREHVVIEVADEGSGISDEDKLHIFDMFSTTSQKKADGRRGMGVGLALCRSIVRAQGGDIRVRDNSPRGAVLSFTLQREAGPSVLPEALQE